MKENITHDSASTMTTHHHHALIIQAHFIFVSFNIHRAVDMRALYKYDI